jgi:hypothetical protein
MTRNQRLQFDREAQQRERVRDGLSRAQLLARELHGVDGELASDGALAHYWQVSLRNALIGQAQVDPNTVPPADAPVFRIRAWLTSNQAVLAQFTHWDIPLTPECPLLFSWIGLFTGLRSLRVVGSEAQSCRPYLLNWRSSSILNPCSRRAQLSRSPIFRDSCSQRFINRTK